jgi:hypothetical protein
VRHKDKGDSMTTWRELIEPLPTLSTGQACRPQGRDRGRAVVPRFAGLAVPLWSGGRRAVRQHCLCRAVEGRPLGGRGLLRRGRAPPRTRSAYWGMPTVPVRTGPSKERRSASDARRATSVAPIAAPGTVAVAPRRPTGRTWSATSGFTSRTPCSLRSDRVQTTHKPAPPLRS